MTKERVVLQDEKEVVRQFGLTNNEWLRYRLVRELPERGNFAVDQTFWTQTKPLAETKPYLTDTEASGLKSLAHFEDKLAEITSFTNKSLQADTLPSSTLSELAQRLSFFQETFNPQHQWIGLTPDACTWLDKNAREWIDRFIIITDNKERSPEEEVEVITTIFRLEGLRDNDKGGSQLADEKIKGALKQRNYPLLAAAILGRDSIISGMAYDTIWIDYLNDERKMIPWRYHPTAVIELIDPLLEATKRAISDPDSLNKVRTYSDLTQRFLDTLLDSERIRLIYQNKGTDLTRVADELLDISLNNFGSNKHFRHDALVALFSILTSLYKLGGKPSKLSAYKIYDGLSTMYAEMVGKYKFSKTQSFVNQYNFGDLAEVMGLDMKRIAS